MSIYIVPECKCKPLVSDLLATLKKIERNEVAVFDHAEGCEVLVSMESGEMAKIARAAIARAEGGAK